MKAQLAERVAGIIISKGSIPKTIAAVARIGKSRLVIAVLDVSSVRKVTNTQTKPTIIRGDNADN